MEEKIIIVDNPTNLPLAELDDFVLFQNDLKMPLTESALQALKASILEHRVFIGKAVARFNGQLLTEDGHQTLLALKSLRDVDGYTKSRVVHYKESKNGNMIEDGCTDYDTILIPYQFVVPQGKDDGERKKDAAAKIAIINSQYATINPNTTFFTSLGFELADIEQLQRQVRLPELSFVNFQAFTNIAGQPKPEEQISPNFNEENDTFLPDTPDTYASDEKETMDTYPNRVIIVYQNFEQKTWLEERLGQTLDKVITPVSVLMKNANEETKEE